MSRLLQEARRRKQMEVDQERSKCEELTERLKAFVRGEEFVDDGYISKGFFTNAEIFPTNCESYQKFVSTINNDASSPVKISTNKDWVDSIRTELDLRGEKVWIKLYRGRGAVW